MLLWLLLIPLFVVVYIRMQQRRRRLVAMYSSLGLAQVSGGRRVGLRRQVSPALYLVALTILCIALARPQSEVSLPRREGTVILAFDVSGSMAADDLQPTRLQAAQAAARDFVARQPSTVRIGVVTFSDGGFATQAPTNDPAPILQAIERLTIQRGTSLARGIEAALTAIVAGADQGPLSLSDRAQTPAPTPAPVPKGTVQSAAIVLLTDGENNQSPDPLVAAQAAADRGIRIYTVGVGSTAGATLNLDGFSVRTRLDEATLQQIAELTGGMYHNAQNEEDLRTVYDTLDPELVIKSEKIEITSLFAGAGIIVLMLGGTLSLLWLGRLP